MQFYYVNFLKNILEARRQRAPGYSLRAFARDCKLSPSMISDVLSGKCGLSIKTAETVSDCLKLKSIEREIFLTSVRYSRAKTLEDKKLEQIKFNNLIRAKKQSNQLNIDQFKLISDWYHFAILEASKLKHFQSQPAWIAKRFQLTVFEVEDAMRRLVNLGYASWKNNTFVAEMSNSSTYLAESKESIISYLSQMLNRAEIELRSSPKECEYSFSILALNKNAIKNAKQLLKKYSSEFNMQFDRDESRTDGTVYALGLQLFPLEKKG